MCPALWLVLVIIPTNHSPQFSISSSLPSPIFSLHDIYSYSHIGGRKIRYITWRSHWSEEPDCMATEMHSNWNVEWVECTKDLFCTFRMHLNVSKFSVPSNLRVLPNFTEIGPKSLPNVHFKQFPKIPNLYPNFNPAWKPFINFQK